MCVNLTQIAPKLHKWMSIGDGGVLVGWKWNKRILQLISYLYDILSYIYYTYVHITPKTTVIVVQIRYSLQKRVNKQRAGRTDPKGKGKEKWQNLDQCHFWSLVRPSGPGVWDFFRSGPVQSSRDPWWSLLVPAGVNSSEKYPKKGQKYQKRTVLSGLPRTKKRPFWEEGPVRSGPKKDQDRTGQDRYFGLFSIWSCVSLCPKIWAFCGSGINSTLR